MDILTCPWEPATWLIISKNVPAVFYYSHGIAATVALVLAVFLLFKKRELETIIFFTINIFFSLWVLFDLIEWASNKNDVIYFFWLVTILVELLIYLLTFYLSYIFFKKKDLPIKGKVMLSSFLLPVILLLPTRYILTKTSSVTCIPVESRFIIYYSYIFEIAIVLLILINFIVRLKKEKDLLNKRKMIFFIVGIVIFLGAFSSGNIIGSFTEDWNLSQYGLFGMPIFMGFIAYLIVKYKAFEVKLIGVQALVVALIILIGSQFAFIRNNTNKILTAITLAIAVVFGWILVRSVKREVKQREELEIANSEIEKRNGEIENRNNKLKKANKEISERKEQLQKMADSLAIANDKLQKLDMAKTEFVSMASHQLRTPPTPIKGYSSMLLEGSYGELNTEQRKAIENISNANNQQIAFVEDLLSVSRIESGSLKFQFEKCHIEEFCQEVIDNLALKARDKNLYLDYKAPAKPLPEITIDGAKVREVISNLVDNAIKYTLKGGVTLYVELCAKKETGCLKKPHLRITVSDTGIGIPADEIPYLFIKFSRGKDITRLNTSGTGLGLYVVKMISEANGGKVWIESPGANLGTKFILELPLEPEKETLERNG